MSDNNTHAGPGSRSGPACVLEGPLQAVRTGVCLRRPPISFRERGTFTVPGNSQCIRPTVNNPHLYSISIIGLPLCTSIFISDPEHGGVLL